MALASVLQQALALSAEERGELAEALLRSLELEDDGETSPECDQAWVVELNRRAKEIDEGRARWIPHEEVFAELRARFPPR